LQSLVVYHSQSFLFSARHSQHTRTVIWRLAAFHIGGEKFVSSAKVSFGGA